MIRVVIVEDEILVRLGMKMCIEEYSVKMKVTGAFSTAEEALEYFKENAADILVTDIHLTGISGLELIKKIHDKFSHMSIIIISCYEDFSYAREAIALGVDRYVLKQEIGEEELPQLVMEQYQLKQQKNMLEGWDYIKDTNENVLEGFGEAFQLALFLVRGDGEYRNTTEEEINFEILTEILQKHLTDGELGECFLHHDKEILALFNFLKKDEIEDGQGRIAAFWREAIESVRNYFNRNLFMVLSVPFYTLTDTKEHYNRISKEQNRTFYYEKPTCIRMECKREEERADVPALKIYGEDILKDFWLEKIKQEIIFFMNRCRMADVSSSTVKENIIKFFNQIELYMVRNFNEMKYEDVFPEKKFLNYQTIDKFDSAEQLQKEMLKELDQIHIYVQGRNNTFSMVEQYIREHYTEQISLTEIAERFHMNSVYFCQYFKKNKGVSYVQFINQLRIEETKRLISQGELPLERIAEKVGIDNTNYFYRLFKKMTGITISEYRKLN
ncbi:MAG: response regulator [Lachnospiraceae bacterium]